MKNWAENVQWNPSKIAYPSTENQIQELIKKSISRHKKIRVIGTGHSFTSLCATNETLISLDNYQGLVAIDKENLRATVKAGTKLEYLGALLFKEGLAMKNLGDVDVQSIAGTISTGTHGTGVNFGSISTQVVAIQFINGKGELIRCSTTENISLFKACQVSLGCLGVITQITIQCVPVYKLRLKNRKEKLATVLENLEQRNRENRNFEFYWIPHTDSVWTKTSNIVEYDEPDKINFFNYWTEYMLENYVFKLFCEYARFFPSQNKTVSKITELGITNVEKVYYSHKVYATQRLVKFYEMEYSVPANAYSDVLKDIIATVKKKKFNIHFPVENRWVQQDDIYMSPAYGRDSAYIACHVYNKKDYKPYFKALEEIFRAYNGRPHWGKMNTLQAKDVESLYPKYGDFMRHKNEQDPYNIFTNKYIEELLIL